MADTATKTLTIVNDKGKMVPNTAKSVTKGADANLLEPVARRTDLGKDLETALELVLVVGAERTFEGEGKVFDVGFCTRGEGAGCRQAQGDCHGECEFADHFRKVLSHSAGLP